MSIRKRNDDVLSTPTLLSLLKSYSNSLCADKGKMQAAGMSGVNSE